MQNEALRQLSDIVQDVRMMKAEIKERKARLKESEDEYKRMTEVDIPSLMDELGVEKFTLTDGTRIILKHDISVRIPSRDSDKKRTAFAWLSGNGGDTICKYEFKVSFGTGEEELDRAKTFRGLLEQNDFDNWSSGQRVHPATLKKFLKERMEEGLPVPLEIFEGHPITKAEIK